MKKFKNILVGILIVVIAIVVLFAVFGKKEDISKSIGKINKTVIGIKDKNLAGAIKKILNGGDVIG